jgi:site-specific recombinase XerD
MSSETAIRQFLEYLEVERGRSLLTLRNYEHYLTTFFGQMRIRNVSSIDDEVIRNFRIWLNRQPGAKVPGAKQPDMKKRTQNYYLIALRSFLRYAMKRGWTSYSPDKIELARVGDRHIDLITLEELKRILQVPDVRTRSGLRDRAILEMLYSTGLRVSELVSLNRDIDLTRSELTVRGKGDKVRLVFLSDDARQWVAKYLGKRADMEEGLFVRERTSVAGSRDSLSYGGEGEVGKVGAHDIVRGSSKFPTSPQPSPSKERGSEDRLTPRSVERIVAECAVAAGVGKKVTPHVIRHSFATSLLENGADIRSVQTLLGHAHIGTTQIYTHVSDKHLKEAFQKFHKK